MFFRFTIVAFAALALLQVSDLAFAHPADENPDLTLPENRYQFQLDRVGLYIHWGLYTNLPDGESVMKNEKLSAAEYKKLAMKFRPEGFDAAQWVSLAKSSGMRYLDFTCNNADGFAMWESKVSDWNIVRATPSGRDVVKELSDECHRRGLKFFASYSKADPHYASLMAGLPSAMVAGSPNASATTTGTTTASIDYTGPQIIELLTRYGKIDGIRLVGWPTGASPAPQFQRAFRFIRGLQPASLIGSPYQIQAFSGLDFQTVNEDSKDRDTSISINKIPTDKMPLEIRASTVRELGHHVSGLHYKSARELVQGIVRAAGMNSNYLMDVTPTADGKIPTELSDTLHLIGIWLTKYGDSIYATHTGPVSPMPWGVTTQRGNRLYVHVLDSATTKVSIKLPSAVTAARYHSDGTDITVQSSNGMTTLPLRPERPGEMERLIVLYTKQMP
jgi:alpha-L-fucosidase